MKVLKEDSSYGTIFKSLEKFMEENKITIEVTYGGLLVTIQEKEFILNDIESPMDSVSKIPRDFSSVRLVVVE